MTSDVRRVLGQEGCIAEKLCQIFSYKFTRKIGNCCSNCDVLDDSSVQECILKLVPEIPKTLVPVNNCWTYTFQNADSSIPYLFSVLARLYKSVKYPENNKKAVEQVDKKKPMQPTKKPCKKISVHCES